MIIKINGKNTSLKKILALEDETKRDLKLREILNVVNASTYKELRSLNNKIINRLIKEHVYPHIRMFNNGSERILEHWENTGHCLKKRHITTRFNLMTDMEEVVLDNGHLIDADPLDAQTRIEGFLAEDNVPYGKVRGHLHTLAIANKYHPVQEWIESIEWDGTNRWPSLFNSIRFVEDTDIAFYKKLIRYWFRSCIAAIFNEHGVASQGILIIVGSQGGGKSRWLKALMPKIGKNWTKDSVITTRKDVNDKDNIMAFRMNWIVEFNEIDSIIGSNSANSVKQFITQDADTFRTPYDVKPKRYPRRTIPFGTANTRNFLIDVENRRFWIIEAYKLLVSEVKKLDIDQFWAQVYHEYLEGLQYWLTDAQIKQLQSYNEKYKYRREVDTTLNPVAFRATSHLVRPKKSEGEPLTVSDIFKRVGLDCNKQDRNTLSTWLRSNKYKEYKGTKGSEKGQNVFLVTIEE